MKKTQKITLRTQTHNIKNNGLSSIKNQRNPLYFTDENPNRIFIKKTTESFVICPMIKQLKSLYIKLRGILLQKPDLCNPKRINFPDIKF